jgi:hypothetical protein
LVGWSAGGLVGWLIGWLVGWLLSWLIGQSVSQSDSGKYTFSFKKISEKCFFLINKSKTQTRRELSWGESIWGSTNQRTNGPTKGWTKSLIEALARA